MKKLENLNIVDLIYQEFDDRNEKRDRKMRHYPSSMSWEGENGEFIGKCRRAVYYAMTGAERTNPIEPTALFKMQMGTDIHERLNEILTSALSKSQDGIKHIRLKTLDKKSVVQYDDGIEVEMIDLGDEQYFLWQNENLKLPFSGYIDKVFEIEFESGETYRIAMEWKSTYGFGANMVKKEGPKEDHLLQAISYLEQNVIPIDALWLVYVARDSGYLFGWLLRKEDGVYYGYNVSSGATFMIKYNLEGIERALGKLEQHIDEGKLPDRDYEAVVEEKEGVSYLHQKKSDWHCRYCDFKDLCYGLG